MWVERDRDRERKRGRGRGWTDNIADSLWVGQWPRFFGFGKTMSKLNVSTDVQQQVKSCSPLSFPVFIA